MSEDKASIQEQLDSRLRSLSKQQPAAATSQLVRKGPSAGALRGYGLISILLVALLAFVIGQLSQNTLPDLLQKVQALKVKYFP